MRRIGAVLSIIFSLSGCAPPATEIDPFSVFPERFREKAIAFERLERYPEALLSWQVVAAFRPYDSEVKGRIIHLKEMLQAKANLHFHMGVNYFHQNRRAEALDSFLTALYYDKSHNQALAYLKTKMVPTPYTLYITRPGDTSRSIAVSQYRDAGKAFLVAAMNSIDPDGPLPPGTEIKLPVLEAYEVTGRPVRPADVLAYPEEAIDVRDAPQDLDNRDKPEHGAQGKERGTPSLIKPADHSQTRSQIEASLYETGKNMLKKKQYHESFTVFNQLDESYRDVRQIKTFLKGYLDREAEKHYLQGIEYFVAENLEKAIGEWRKALKLNPDHKKARHDLERAIDLQKRLQGMD